MHVDGWQHLTEDVALVPEAFTRRGLADRLVVLTPGIVTAVSSYAAGASADGDAHTSR
jgi:hypothetical protein